MGYIYCIYYKEQPVYVGQTIKTIEERWQEHCQAARRNEKHKHYNIHNFMFDNGINNFSIKEIEKTNKFNKQEEFWIKTLKTHKSENGYNITHGGQTCPDDIKLPCHQYNIKGQYLKSFSSINEAEREVHGNHSNIIKVLQGELNTAYGFRWSLQKISNLPPLQTNYTGTSKKIYQYDLEGNLLNVFNSTREAARSLNKSQGNISLAASGKRKTAYGFLWKYENQ